VVLYLCNFFLFFYHRYRPNCDGTCDGSKHNNHGRVATAVLYCKVRLSFSVYVYNILTQFMWLFIRIHTGSREWWGYNIYESRRFRETRTWYGNIFYIQGHRNRKNGWFVLYIYIISLYFRSLPQFIIHLHFSLYLFFQMGLRNIVDAQC